MIKSKNKVLMRYYDGIKIDNHFIIQEMFTCFRYAYPAGFLFKGESHAFFEMVVVLSGNVRLTVGEVSHNLTGGQVIFFNPGYFHAMYNDGDSPVEMIVISFSAINFPKSDTTYTISDDDINEILDIYDQLNNYFDIVTLERVMKIPEDPERSCKSIVNGIREGYLLEAALVIKRLELFVLNAVLNGRTIGTSQMKYENNYYGQIIATMEAHVFEKMTCARLASLCNISVSLMEKTMYKHLGCGTMKYFNILKMQKALMLLKEGFSVKEVAEHLGFDSQSYFSASFKRHFGYPPTAAKKGGIPIEID